MSCLLPIAELNDPPPPPVADRPAEGTTLEPASRDTPRKLDRLWTSKTSQVFCAGPHDVMSPWRRRDDWGLSVQSNTRCQSNWSPSGTTSAKLSPSSDGTSAGEPSSCRGTSRL